MNGFMKQWGMTLFLAGVLLAGSLIALLPEAVMTAADPSPVLVIDAGHGEPDGGAVASDGTAESGINLDIANRLYGLANMFCVPAVRTRTGESGLWDGECDTIREKKNSDMNNRVSAVNAVPGAVLVSIHQNAYDGFVRGAQVFARSEEMSEALSLGIERALKQRQDIPTRASSQIPSGLYLFRNTSCPAVIVECGYITDPSDLSRLQDPAYREWVAVAVLHGYLTTVCDK